MGEKKRKKSRFDTASKEAVTYCDTYFRTIVSAAASGKVIRDGRPILPMYPTMLLAYEWKQGYAFELLGSTDNYNRLSLVKRRVKSINDVMGNFAVTDYEYAFTSDEGTSNSGISSLRIAHIRDEQTFNSRYPGMSTIHSTTIHYTRSIPDTTAYNAIAISDNIASFKVYNVLTVNSYAEFVRMRYFHILVIVSKNQDVKNTLATFFPLTHDLSLLVPQHGKSESDKLNRAANFASLTSTKTHETTIGNFLEQNRDILLSALNARELIAQPEFKWIKSLPGNVETSIIPDFIFIDYQDAAHLCELKLPMLGRKSLTKGARSRRRFIDGVAEGIAQLANYEEYFLYPENASYALQTHGIKLDNPRKVLIVGSFENFHTQQVHEANRERGINAPEIIDYDTVRNAYLLNEGVII